MKKIKLKNGNLKSYFDTVEELKKYPTMEEYKAGYRKLRDDDAYAYEINNYRSVHTELRRLDKKRKSLIEGFIIELNPISSSTARTAAKSSGNFDVLHERMLYSKTLSEKSDDEIVALVIKKRTEAALELKRSVKQSLQELSDISSMYEMSHKKRNKPCF
ncbi:TPA: DUF4756 family protein [Escherichia coli]|nr:DUF4756 family protein [Escherichia coli]